MTSDHPIIPWTAEDDLLLKNAVEAGASLEALAKGAIQFSRRFSLSELQGRWYSLLYDPCVSTHASAHMFELEISGINPSSRIYRSENNPKGKEISKKRKSESIRRKYYALRKKYRNDIFTSPNLGFFEPDTQYRGHISDFPKQEAHDSEPSGQNYNMADLLDFQEEDLDFLRKAFPETATDIAAATDAITTFSQNDCHNNSYEDNLQNGGMESYGFGETLPSSLPQGGNDMMEAQATNSETPLISDSNAVNGNGQMFQPPNLDGFAPFETNNFAPELCPVPVDTDIGDTAQVSQGMFHDVTRKENITVYANEFGNPDSLLNLSVDDEILVDVDDIEPKSFINKVEPSSVPLASAHTLVSEIVAQPPVCGDQQINTCPEVNVPIMLVSDFSEPGGEKIYCTLNTEDTEIPCNDDIFLLIHPSTSFCGTAAPPTIITNTDAPASACEKDNEQAVNLPTNAKDSAKPFGWPQKIRTQGLSESHPFVGRAVKTELNGSNPQTLLTGFASKNMNDSGKGKCRMIPVVSNDRLVEKDVSGFATRAGGNPSTAAEVMPSTEVGCSRQIPPESVDESSASDQEESRIEEDVPYFSDVEAMILDMDLVPYDHDSQIIRQAPGYQYDESKKTLIRLEQGARACMHRNMTSKGSLAILYGRKLRCHIKKPEVLLGRSTDDINVDIDLREEGHANKISRRQAIIKMDDCGSFVIKNLGKSSVSVNGMSVATGQFLTLSSGCLIEIKGMGFVFEINERYVKQHMRNILNKNKGKLVKFEPFPEDQPFP